MATTVSIPASSSNVIVDPFTSTALNILSIVGGIIASNHIDVGSLINTITGGSFWGGLAAVVIPQVINHFAITGSNNATKAALAPQNPQSAAAS